MQHAEIAVHRVGRMHEHAAGPGRGERGGNLLGDQARLPHPCHHDLAATAVQEVHRGTEGGVDPVRQCLQRVGFQTDDVPRFPQLLELRETDAGGLVLGAHGTTFRAVRIRVGKSPPKGGEV